MARYISYSLFGNNPRYTRTLIKVARRYRSYYPGWIIIVFYDESVPTKVIKDLKASGVALRKMVNQEGQRNGMLWRYQAVQESDAELVIFRDADSKLTRREAEAVSDWDASTKTLHIMRDHPYHSSKIMGGMFGVRTSKQVREAFLNLTSDTEEYGADQELLEKVVYPVFVRDALVHASSNKFENFARAFPKAWSLTYVGEVETLSPIKFYLRIVRQIAFIAECMSSRE